MIPAFIADLVIEKAIKIAIENAPKIISHLKGEGKGKIVAYRQVEEYKRAIIFIHGFTGSPTETFTNIPELMIKEEKLNGYDILSMGYSSSVIPDLTAGFWAADPDIDSLAEYFKTIIENQFSKYETFSIVTHSMGGLIAQQGILKLSDDNFKKIKNLIMFGTPSGGLEIANSRFLGMLKKQSLNMGTKSEFILKLRSDWQQRFNDEYPFSFKAVAGLSDQFVKRESSIMPFGDAYRFQIEGNHSTMVKADNNADIQNQCFGILLNDLVADAHSSLKASSYALNTLMAKYSQIVSELENDIDNLDAKGLKKLALSLDGLGQEDRAISILEAHRLSKENTDIMGILGGRYKRKYLYSGNKASDAEKAVKCYKQGLKIAEENEDKHQIYYHAINLAFLSLTYLNKRADMKRYAELALSHCNEDSINVWELATIAEANLYLENMEKAKQFYVLIKEKTENQIRMRSSIYINAKFAYQELQGFEEDEF